MKKIRSNNKMQKLAQTKILVTGGAGFIGSHLVDELIRKDCKVVVIDNLSTGKKKNLNKKARFYKLDITNPRVFDAFKREKPQVVFHFAARVEARISVKDPLSDAKTNILGSINILENCRKFKVKKIIFSSSGGEIYGDAKEIPTPETYKPKPISPYGVAKLAVEGYLESYSRIFKIPFISLRLGNVYGPRQNPDGEAGVVAIFSDKMLKNKGPLLIHGSGNQSKDYIFVKDVTDASILSVEKEFKGILNIGTGRETSVLDIFYKLKKLTRSNIGQKHIAFPSIGFKRGCLSVKKVKKMLNWEPKINLDKGLEITVDWFKRQNNLKFTRQ